MEKNSFTFGDINTSELKKIDFEALYFFGYEMNSYRLGFIENETLQRSIKSFSYGLTVSGKNKTATLISFLYTMFINNMLDIKNVYDFTEKEKAIKLVDELINMYCEF